MVIILAALGILFCSVGFLAYRRSHSSFRWILISSAAVAVLGAGFLAVIAFGITYSRPESGAGLATVQWLDSRASKISYYRANDFEGTFAYEFRISLADFEKLARERSWETAPITKSCNITRYSFFLPETDTQRQEPLFAEFAEGLFFESRQPNGGGITVLYDTPGSRAYVFQSSR